jgi:hypothetical protein
MSSLIIPVSAFIFDFQYFETDKLVYEVGETINMAAKIIADFSPEGWCYVSFSVATDIGPAFADEYFISPQPSARILNSTYIIRPEDVSPGENGSQAYVLFSAEVFDTVSQGAEDSIEVNIVRGQLTATPLTSLIVESGIPTTVSLRIISVHNNNISYPNEPINILVKDSSSAVLQNINVTTDLDGSLSFDLNSSLYLPGNYVLMVTGFGNNDFLGFSKAFQIDVYPADANLTILSAPESVQCQSPDGSHFESADIVVSHESKNQTGIDDSSVYWSAAFGNGTFSNLGNGVYSSLVDFRTVSGHYIINITAVNTRFQTVSIATTINVVKNILHFSPVQNDLSVVKGNTTILDFVINESQNWGNEITVCFQDLRHELSIETNIIPGSFNSLLVTGWYNLTVGPHIIAPCINSNYYEFANDTSAFELTILGTLKANITVVSAYYGESLDIDLGILDKNNATIDTVTLSVYCDNEIMPFIVMTQVSTTEKISIQLPLRISLGNHSMRLEFSVPYYIPMSVNTNVSIWMRTNITIIIETHSINASLIFKDTICRLTNQERSIALSISSGSIIRPPPILLRGTTSTVSLTTRDTSCVN